MAFVPFCTVRRAEKSPLSGKRARQKHRAVLRGTLYLRHLPSSEVPTTHFQQVSWLTDRRPAAPSHARWHNGVLLPGSPLTVTGSLRIRT
jgi:hypothetical protein